MSIYEPLAPQVKHQEQQGRQTPRWVYVAGFVVVAAAIAGGVVALVTGAVSGKSAPPPQTVEDYLIKIDDFLDSRPRQTFMPNNGGLMQVFGPGSIGGGDCGKDCELELSCPFLHMNGFCRYDVYDNALAAIYYTARGKHAQAKAILDGFIYYMYVKKEEVNKQVTVGADEGLPSGRYLSLLAASYTSAPSKPGQYAGDGVADGAVDTGNNAWVGIALMRYAAAAGAACYATAAKDILYAVNLKASCDDQLGGFLARLAPYPMNYRSTEHNIDMFVLSAMARNTTLAAHASSFVAQMFDQDKRYPGTYVTGTSNAKMCSSDIVTNAIPVDTQSWNFLAGVDPALPRKVASMGFVAKPTDRGGLWESNVDLIGNEATGRGKGDAYWGTRFSSYGVGIQWENAGSGILALIKLVTTPKDVMRKSGTAAQIKELEDAAEQGRDSIKRLIDTYGSVPASLLGGNYDMWMKRGQPGHSAKFPGGSDTGLGWPYLRYPHVASTVWGALALMYQGEKGGPVNELANPYSATQGFEDYLYSGDDKLCMPAKPPVDWAICTKHPRCVMLNLTNGDCCPTPTGVELGCCDMEDACIRHPKCAGLEGKCCPTATGDRLECCDA